MKLPKRKSRLVYNNNNEHNVKTSVPVICFDKLYVGAIVVDIGLCLIYNLKDGKVVFREQHNTEDKCKRAIKDALKEFGAKFNDIIRI